MGVRGRLAENTTVDTTQAKQRAVARVMHSEHHARALHREGAMWLQQKQESRGCWWDMEDDTGEAGGPDGAGSVGQG